MRSLSLIILALGFVLTGSSMAGSADGNLPGVGTFAYDVPHDCGDFGDPDRRGALTNVVKRLGAAVIAVLCLSAAHGAHAQVRNSLNLSDPRGDFVRQCAPHMLGRWAHPEEVCGCLHDHAAGVVEDHDLRQALLRGIGETGVPTIESEWVPASKQSQIGPTFTTIAKPALQCMFEPAK